MYLTHVKSELENGQPAGIDRHLAQMTESEHQQCDVDRTQAQIPFDEDFDCLICKHVVQNPLACSECDRLFCTLCINQWHLRKKECPHCRQKSDMRRVSRILLKQINKVKFKCPDETCRVSFTLDDTKKHKSTCNRKVKVECKACGLHTVKCKN